METSFFTSKEVIGAVSTIGMLIWFAIRCESRLKDMTVAIATSGEKQSTSIQKLSDAVLSLVHEVREARTDVKDTKEEVEEWRKETSGVHSRPKPPPEGPTD